ncbi:hypothetical protein BET03_13175 [Thermohalobacter berrensis]|uniref:MurNAc-LAA domain-containing protein n=1 Tax=Thermohalobacter berrensis TaxID=99594 RepID=A0A419T0E9_9FIRM|nr:hypothetical protein BET03_13175 [Thermohalobacter berrensis]
MIIRKKTLVIILIFIFLILLLSTIIIKTKRSTSVFKVNSISNKNIVIDPGHGGIDGGTFHRGSGLLEKDVNLDISLKLKKTLNHRKANVILTRDKDISLENKSNINASRYRRDLNARKEIINRNNPDVFVSIHVNANPSNLRQRGAIIFYYPTSDKGKKLAKEISYKIDTIIYKNLLKTNSIKTQVLPGDYYILRETSSPGVLIEVGFITNPKDRKLLTNPKFQEEIARAICEGIAEYLN